MKQPNTTLKIKLQNKNLEIRELEIDGRRVAEVSSDDILLEDVRSGTELLVDIYYQGYDKIILKSKNINPDFFDLRSGFAGEILQAVSNFRFQLAISGDFSKYSSSSLKSFISESNTLGQISFEDLGK